MSLTVARSLRSTVYGGDFGLSNFFYNSEVGGVIDLAPLDTSWRRNLLTYTDNFANAVWNKTFVSVVSNSVAGPLLGTLADTMEATDTTIPYFSQLTPIEAGKVYTFSGYFKKKDVTTVSLLIYGTDFNNGGGNLGADFNLDTGTITFQTTSGATMTNLGGGWYRCSVTHTATTTKSAAWQLCRYGGASTTIGFGTYLFGAQAEQAATPSAYQSITDFHTEVRAMHPAAKLFQDTAGLQPVTAPGQTVALALMKGAREVEARRNLISPTEDIHQWGGATLGTPVANAIAAPNGTITADLIVEGTTNQRHFNHKTPTFLTNKWYTFSVYAKAGTRGFVGVVVGKGGSPFSRVGVVVNLSDGSFTNYSIDAVPDVIRHPVENLPDGWKRIAVSVYTGAAMTDGYAEVWPSNGSSTYLGDGVSGVYLWGAQVELGAAPTAYQSVSLADGSWTPGQHFVQSSASLRPTYAVRPKGGRKNLLTYTEQFDNAVWAKSQVTINPNAITSPDGTLSADKIVESSVDAFHTASQYVSFIPATTAVSLSIYLKAGERNKVRLQTDASGGSAHMDVDLALGLSPSGSDVNRTITDVGGGWYKCSFSLTTDVDGGAVGLKVLVCNTSYSSSYLGDGTSGVYVWGAQINLGATATPYQRVTTIYDVYEAGKTHYGALWFDGVDDFMVSGTVTPGTDKVQVFAGVRKNSDAAVAILIESSVTSASNNGTFAVFAPNAAASNYLFRSKGTVASDAIALPHAAQTSQTLVGYGDIATDTSALRVNAVAAVTSATDQGTGNYLAYPIYLGRRAGTSVPFNGEIEALIGYRFGPNLSDTQLTQIATFINSRTGAY